MQGEAVASRRNYRWLVGCFRLEGAVGAEGGDERGKADYEECDEEVLDDAGAAGLVDFYTLIVHPPLPAVKPQPQDVRNPTFTLCILTLTAASSYSCETLHKRRAGLLQPVYTYLDCIIQYQEVKLVSIRFSLLYSFGVMLMSGRKIAAFRKLRGTAIRPR